MTARGRPRVAVDIEAVRALLAAGVPLREIARQTGYSRATIRRRLAEAERSAAAGPKIADEQRALEPGGRRG